MVELEIQVHSDRREGLLTELGHVVVTNHFSLLRQRLTQDSRGAWLSMLVRGPAEQRFALEEMLGTHTRVLSFEAALAGEVMPLSAPAAPVAKITETMAQPVVEEPAPMPEPPAALAPPVTPDISQVEHILPKLAQDYPHIYPWLVALENSVADSVRESCRFFGRGSQHDRKHVRTRRLRAATRAAHPDPHCRQSAPSQHACRRNAHAV